MERRGEIISDEDISVGKTCRLTEENRLNLLLWKPRAGEAFTISDTSGKLFRARLKELGKDTSTLCVFEDTGFKKDNISITLLQALPEKERMELIIQKTTELGVGAIVPFKSKKSISIEEREARQKKSHRWGDIALKAAKQSRREFLPEILPCRGFKEALDIAKDAGLKIMLLEGGGLISLKEFLKGKKTDNATLLVGPEGGFEKEEVDYAVKRGFIAVTLGRNILRTETAAIFGVGVVGYEMGS